MKVLIALAVLLASATASTTGMLAKAEVEALVAERALLYAERSRLLEIYHAKRHCTSPVVEGEMVEDVPDQFEGISMLPSELLSDGVSKRSDYIRNGESDTAISVLAESNDAQPKELTWDQEPVEHHHHRHRKPRGEAKAKAKKTTLLQAKMKTHNKHGSKHSVKTHSKHKKRRGPPQEAIEGMPSSMVAQGVAEAEDVSENVEEEETPPAAQGAHGPDWVPYDTDYTRKGGTFASPEYH